MYMYKNVYEMLSMPSLHYMPDLRLNRNKYDILQESPIKINLSIDSIKMKEKKEKHV